MGAAVHDGSGGSDAATGRASSSLITALLVSRGDQLNLRPVLLSVCGSLRLTSGDHGVVAGTRGAFAVHRRELEVLPAAGRGARLARAAALDSHS